MKRIVHLAAMILAVLCLCGGMARADHASRVNFLQQYRGAVTAADSTYGKYTRGYWDKAIAERYDGLAVTQKPGGYTRYLSNRGCRLFTFAHAVQLLTGEKASLDRQVEILAEFLQVYDDPPTAKDEYAAHLLKAYGDKHGIKKVTVSKSWSAAKAHFAQGGVIIFNSGGHIVLAVDCTERVIDGKSEKLVLLVDSAIEATARRVSSGVCYSGDFSQTYNRSKNVKPAWNAYGRLWIRYSDFSVGSWQTCFVSETARKLVAQQAEPLDRKLRIAVVDAADCPVKESPADTSADIRAEEPGAAIHCAGAIKASDGSTWYMVEDGGYVCAEHVTAYIYTELCPMAARFRTRESMVSRLAPHASAPQAASIAADATVTVRQLLVSEDGDLFALLADGWYLLYYDLSSGQEKLQFSALTGSIGLSGMKSPTGDLTLGASFGLRGVIQVDAPIYSVSASVTDRELALPALETVTAKPSSLVTALNINTSVNGVNINSRMKFGALLRGWYNYTLQVQLGLTYQGATLLLGDAQTVVTSDFTVGNPPGQPVLPDVGVKRLPGDADDDGTVTLADALCVLSYTAGDEVQINLSNADVAGENGVNLEDALRIMQYIAGWNVTLQ